MVEANDASSLIGRVRSVLVDIIKDVRRGPIYAYRMLSAAEKYNLLDMIKGLIENNDARLEFEMGNAPLIRSQYEQAWDDFNNRVRSLTGNKKRFGAVEFYLMVYQQHELTLKSLNHLGTVLRTFREQVENAASGYYARLSRVTETLVNTFQENRDALASEKILQTSGGFATPMMTITELKGTLDQQIENLNIPGMLDAFMALLLAHEEDWLQDDENRIVKLVTDFFLNTAFHDFANRTITLFLKDKYQERFKRTITDEELSKLIYDEWVAPLSEKARPLFYFDSSIWQESDTGKLAFLSYPSSSAPIKAAVESLHRQKNLFQPKDSAMTDRIFVMSSDCGLPLSAYSNCREYEKMFFSSQAVGRHYYEGKPIPGMDYNDWRKLPSILPQSVLVLSNLPPDLAKSVKEAQALYEEARAKGVLDDESHFRRPDESGLDRLRSACRRCEEVIAATATPEDFPELDKAVDAVDSASNVPMISTGVSLPIDGNRKNSEVIFRVQEDHFVYSPALHNTVREILDEIQEAAEAADKLRRKAEEKKQALLENESKMENQRRAYADYCDALFSGVIVMEGKKLYYPLPLGRKPLVLSEVSDEFPYNKIPVYQGYLSYQKTEDRRKTAMREEYQKRLRESSPELHAAVEQMKTDLSEEKLTAMVHMAESFKNEDEICDFLEKIYRDFETFCMNL